MATKRINPKIKEFQKRETPINYANLPINKVKLEERSAKLKERIVCGYGVIWGSCNDYGETFVKGCCAKSISENGPSSDSAYKIKLRDRHGKSVSLFAKLKEDDTGLYFESMPLDKVQWADDLLTQLQSGTINNFSIGFKHCWDKVEWDEENDCLVCLEIQLYEISAVDIPSDMETYAVRSIESEDELLEEVEEFISILPKSKQLEARKIFTRCISLSKKEPPEQKRNALKERKPKKTGIDYKSLIKQL
jgi:hypothetical protein